MMKSKRSPSSKTLSFKHTEGGEEHNYPTPMETASSNKRDRGNGTHTNTPEKVHLEKKAKGSSAEVTTTSETLLKAIDALGKPVDDRMEEISSLMQQHSMMQASISKTVQVNSQELKECKMKVKNLEKEMEILNT